MGVQKLYTGACDTSMESFTEISLVSVSGLISHGEMGSSGQEADVSIACRSNMLYQLICMSLLNIRLEEPALSCLCSNFQCISFIT